MFFWVVLGSLVSLITWGKISENARSPDNHVVPVYETMVASLSVQNKIASEYVQMKSAQFEQTEAAVGSAHPMYPADSGTVFTVTSAGKINPASNAELADGGAYAKSRYHYVKLAAGFKTAYYCVRKNDAEEVIQSSTLSENKKCYLGDRDDTGLFVITYGRGIGTYSTANLQYFFKAVERAEPGAKNIGVLKRAYRDESGVLHEKTSGTDDASTLYWIYAVGRSFDNAAYLPKGIVSAMKTAEGLNDSGTLEGYYILIESLRHKGVSCLLTSENCG